MTGASRIFSLVAIACFAISAVPGAPAGLLQIGLVFFVLAHMFP
jgi:hypothetical protein